MTACGLLYVRAFILLRALLGVYESIHVFGRVWLYIYESVQFLVCICVFLFVLANRCACFSGVYVLGMYLDVLGCSRRRLAGLLSHFNCFL